MNLRTLHILENFDDEGRLPAWPKMVRLLIAPTIVSLIAVALAQIHYIVFHTVAEFFSIVIAMTAMVVATTSLGFTRNHFTVYVAVALGWCAGIDLLHVIAYPGMNLLVPDDVDLSSQLWIAARLLQAVALLGATMFLRRPVHLGLLHASLGLLVATLLALIFYGYFPETYVQDKGLTAFKINAEYVIIILLAGAGWLLHRSKAQMSRGLYLSMFVALLLMILMEFAFTQYVSVYGSVNMVGHILKIFAFWFVYLALVQSTLREPFSMLSRTASTYDAVPEPAFVVGADGLILQANQAAGRYAGLPVESLVRKHAHVLFHAPSVAVVDCPVCAALARGESGFSMEIERGEGLGVVECTVAPFMEEKVDPNFVQVVRDVTQAKRLQAERENLVWTLGERVKELRSQYAVTEILEHADDDQVTMLRQVLEVLPSGFLYPQYLRACFVDESGLLGHPGSEQAVHVLESEVSVGAREIGRMRVFYGPDMPQQSGDPFLPEERELLRNVTMRVGQTLERKQSQRQVIRLNALYEMLSATNRAIVRCKANEELIASLFDALIQHSTFPLLFIALTDTGEFPLRLVYSHGISDEKRDLLQAVVTDKESQIYEAFNRCREGEVIWEAIPVKGKHDDWISYLKERGFRDRALMPLMREGNLAGVVVLFTERSGAFDAAQIRLLSEMTEDLAFALDSLAQKERRRLAEQRADISEHRFRELFRGSPLPMQIVSRSTSRLIATNQAFQDWLGYAATDFATHQDLFQRILLDAGAREEVELQWKESVAQAVSTGKTITSPEFRLRAKDGSERIAFGSLTVLGDDIIIALTDLTEIRRGEQALRESEQHFRGLVEQTFTGVYVSSQDHIVYVNPRLCDILGWSEAELLGRDLLDVLHPDPASVELLRQKRQSLDAGGRSVSLALPARRKDGSQIELGLHATAGSWDGSPARIVMVQDITERKQAEEKIAGYVKRLEVAMRGTLQAVSAMVDLRDPYTAGHERRVGQIASAIAAEMGWPAERCQALEMIGLVHDIGKIAVPAEILAKPGKLTEVEMALVKGHARAGYDILKDVPFDFPVAETIYQHHERLDGSGYPRGLQGEAILPEARVLAVADVLESMFSHRPYRPARGLAAALAELEGGRGTHYDAQVVDAVQRLVRDKGYVLPE